MADLDLDFADLDGKNAGLQFDGKKNGSGWVLDGTVAAIKMVGVISQHHPNKSACHDDDDDDGIV